MFPSLPAELDTRSALIAAPIAAGATLWIGYRLLTSSSRAPGPRGLPIVGNYFDIPSSTAYPWVALSRLSKKHKSTVIHLNVLGTPIIVINTAEAAKELLEKKSGIYSDRPRMVAMNELVGFDWHFGFMPYNDDWKAHRKEFAQSYNPAAALKMRPLELKTTHLLLRRLLETPEEFLTHLQYMASGVVLKSTYGVDAQDSNDPFVGAAVTAVGGLCESYFGSYLVDYLPFLRYVPGLTRAPRDAKKSRAAVDTAAFVPHSIVKPLFDSRSAPPSHFVDMMEKVQQGPNYSAEERIVRQTASAMFASGSAASVSSMQTFCLAMALHPEIQKKAQREIDESTGGVRLPSFEDMNFTPYLKAIIKEIARWRPVTPMAFPHAASEDDTHEGHFIRKGTVVFPNVFAMMNDETVYPQPTMFNPERFTDPSNEQKDPDTISWGFGRRQCPGKHMANSELWIVFASLLSSFNITVDKNDMVKEDHEYSSGFICYPAPFKCTILPRSKDAKELVLETVNIDA